MAAKIEAPVLIHWPDGLPVSYLITAVDKTGTFLLQAGVAPRLDVKEEKFIRYMSEAIPNPYSENRSHFITKRELIEFIKRRFPGKQASEPIAIGNLFLEGSRHSNMQTFWHFRIERDEGSVEIEADEYLMDAYVSGYKPLDENSNRAVISNRYGGSPHLNRFRMARLVTPLNLNTNASERSVVDRIPNEPLKFEGVPLE